MHHGSVRLSHALAHFDLANAGEVSARTRQWYQTNLSPMLDFLGDVPLATVTANDLRRWRLHLLEKDEKDYGGYRPVEAGKLSPATVRGYLRALKRFFNWCESEGLRGDNPSRRLKLPPLPKQPPKNVAAGDLHKLLSTAAHEPRDLAVVCFLADTACRVSGLCGLDRRHLYLDELRAEVLEKGQKGRSVFFSPVTYAALVRYLATRDDDDAAVFVGQRGRLTPSGVYQLLQRLGERAGVSGRVNPHAFRHGWAREALSNGASLGVVSQMLGHSDVHVTDQFYGRWNTGELQQWHARVSPLARLSVDDILSPADSD